MCVISGVFDGYQPIIPYPKPIEVFPMTVPMPTVPWGPVPNTGQQLDADGLRALLDAFHKSVEAARAADKAAGQPDCEDPEKAKLLARVDELERRLTALERKPRRKGRK